MILKGYGVYLHAPPIIQCDNLSTAVYLSLHPIYYAHTEHIEGEASKHIQAINYQLTV